MADVGHQVTPKIGPMEKVPDAVDCLDKRADALKARMDTRADADDKTKISKSALITKLESSTMSMLESAWRNANTDPTIKKLIEKEMDSRANRGASKGYGEK